MRGNNSILSSNKFCAVTQPTIMNQEILRAETTVYRIEPDNDDWYEYICELYRGYNLIDRWDSLHETYNGVEGQRLSFDEAREAAQEIRESVNNGDVEDWFDLPAVTQL